MGMPVRDMEGARVSASVFSGLHALYNGIEANILDLADALKTLFIALETLGAPQAIYNLFCFVYVLLFHSDSFV